MSFQIDKLQGSTEALNTYLRNGYSLDEALPSWDEEKYFWKSLDILYQDGAFGIDDQNQIIVHPEYELDSVDTSINMEPVGAEIRFEVPEANVELISDHFRRYNEPIISLFSAKGHLEVEEEYDEGDKNIKYNLSRANNIGAFMEMEARFMYPEVSGDIETIIEPRIERYLESIKSRRLEKYL